MRLSVLFNSVSFQFKGGSSALGAPLTAQGWLNTDERPGPTMSHGGHLVG